MTTPEQEQIIPLPSPTELSRPHWDACREGKLLVQRCNDCGTYIFIPQPRCTQCQSAELAWVESSGRGKVYSYSIVHRAPRPQFDTPYVVAVIELEEGWHMLSNLVDCILDDVRVDLQVKVLFERKSDEIYLPMFAPTPPEDG